MRKIVFNKEVEKEGRDIIVFDTWVGGWAVARATGYQTAEIIGCTTYTENHCSVA